MLPDRKSLAYFLLRVAFGTIFLIFGIQKLAMGPVTFAHAVSDQFANSPMPAPIAYAFALVLPFLEFGLGLLVTVGLFTIPALAGTGVLLIILTFGLAVSGQGQLIPGNLAYVLINFVLLFAAEYDRWSLDRRLRPSASGQA